MTSKSRLALISFNLLYIVPFTIYYLSIHNYEFIWYVLVLVFFFVLILSTLHKTHFGLPVLWGLSIWGLLHMAGGGMRINGHALYDLMLVPLVSDGEFSILKYDQAVHCFGFGVTTLAGFYLLRPHLNERANWKMVYFFLVTFGTGLGALNEIVEFMAVLASPNTGVGSYTNTALDLVFNLLGSLTAVLLIHFYFKKNAYEL